MSLALSIQPFSDVLDMWGNPDPSSTFSLSGQISVSLASPLSLFSRRRTTARILLQSLTITFEGQSEVLSPSTGYACVRLCSVTRELLSSGPVDLSNEGHEESDKPCLWNIVFDIPIPGWLPTTSVYGDASLQAPGTSYALYATATFTTINHSHSPYSLANICRPIRSRTRTVDAHRYPIILQRFVEPHSGPSLNTFPMNVYVVDARRSPDSDTSSREAIPDDILEKIQVIVSIPSATSMDEASFPFILRVRGRELGDFEGKQLRVTEFSVDVEQVEVYRNNLSPNEVDQYPIPPQSRQPPRLPLRNPHSIHALYDTAILGTFGSSTKRSFSILAPTEPNRYIISGGSDIFEASGRNSSEDSWYILETQVPILTEPYMRDWAGVRRRRITERTPLFSVEHYVHVAIHYEYRHSGGTILERLNFSLPMNHVNLPEFPISPRYDTENQHQVVQKSLPRKQSLPAYSQLFHSNGEQKVDYSTPLPLYEPPTSSMLSDIVSNQQRTP